MAEVNSADVLTVAAAFLIAVLTGLGVGSGGLLVIYLTAFCSVAQLEAQSVNLIFFLFAAGTSLMLRCAGTRIDPRALALIVSGGAVGAFVGSYLASVTDPELLSSLFGALLIISGSVTLILSIKRSAEARRKGR